MKREDHRHEGAAPPGAGGSVQKSEQQQHGSGMEQNIGQVMPPGLEANTWQSGMWESQVRGNQLAASREPSAHFGPPR